MNALFDTNILIDYLNGLDQARDEIERYESPMISPISWMEVMVGVPPEQELVVRGFLNRFRLVPIDSEVAERAVKIRQKNKVRLPDAIIWASAQTQQALLVSRNSKDFPADFPGVRRPYQL